MNREYLQWYPAAGHAANRSSISWTNGGQLPQALAALARFKQGKLVVHLPGP